MSTQEFEDRAPLGMGTSDESGRKDPLRTAGEYHEHSGGTKGKSESSSCAAIERDIDRTRARIEAHAEELEGRIRPKQLFDDAVERLSGGGASELLANLRRDVRDKPLPLLLTGAGLAWLMFSDGQRRGGEERWSDSFDDEDWAGNGGDRSISDVVHDGARRARAGARNLKDRAGDVSSRIGGSMRGGRERVRDAKEGIGEGLDRLRSGWMHTLDEHPLLLGFLGLAAGAAIAAAFPSTEAEDEWLGGAGDELKDRVGEKGQKLAGEARRYAEHAFTGNGDEAHGAESPRAGSESDRPSGDGNERSRGRASNSGSRNVDGAFFSSPNPASSSADRGD